MCTPVQKWTDAEVADIFAINFWILVEIVMREHSNATDDAKFTAYCTMRGSRRSEMNPAPTLHRFLACVLQLQQLKSQLREIKNMNDWRSYASNYLTSNAEIQLPRRYWGPGRTTVRGRVIMRLWAWVRSLKSTKLQFGWRYAFQSF